MSTRTKQAMPFLTKHLCSSKFNYKFIVGLNCYPKKTKSRSSLNALRIQLFYTLVTASVNLQFGLNQFVNGHL